LADHQVQESDGPWPGPVEVRIATWRCPECGSMIDLSSAVPVCTGFPELGGESHLPTEMEQVSPNAI